MSSMVIPATIYSAKALNEHYREIFHRDLILIMNINYEKHKKTDYSSAVKFFLNVVSCPSEKIFLINILWKYYPKEVFLKSYSEALGLWLSQRSLLARNLRLRSIAGFILIGQR